jgi:hypothetical protein
MTESSSLAVFDNGHVFSDIAAFDAAQRMAKALSSSTLVPEIYQGQQGFANSLIAMEIAGRMRMSPLLVMQNLHIVKGRPSWSSQFLIAKVNADGRFTPLRFVLDDQDNPSWCYAESQERTSGEILRGEKITLEMVKREGWYSKIDRHGKETSKWQSFPGQMFRYRAASFWARVYCPEISLGLTTSEEAIDIEPVQVTVSEPQPPEILDDTPKPAATPARDTGASQSRGNDRAKSEGDAREINGGVDGAKGAEGGVHSDVPTDNPTPTLNPVSNGVHEAIQAVIVDGAPTAPVGSISAPNASVDPISTTPAPLKLRDSPNHDLSIPESVSTATPVAADPSTAPAPLKLRDKQQLIRTVNGLPKEKVDGLTDALIAKFGFDNQTQISIQLTHQGHADFIHAFIKGQ